MISIITVGTYISTSISGIQIENIGFNHTRSLLDANIVIINPEAARRLFDQKNKELNEITQTTDEMLSFFEATEIINSRQAELEIFSEKKRIIIVLCTEIYNFRQPSNYTFTASFDENISNYDFLPFPIDTLQSSFKNGKGNYLKLVYANHFFSNYFKVFEKDAAYHVYFDEYIKQEYEPFIENKAGQIVGFSRIYSKSLFVFLPVPKLTNDPKFIGSIIECSKKFLFNDLPQDPPTWLSNFVLPNEKEISSKIATIQKKIDSTIIERKKEEAELEALIDFKKLLYEKGIPLELIVQRAFEKLDFRVSKFKQGDLEHDLIIESEEGRAILEIEGKDNSSINIDKLDQLSRVVDEDFTFNDKLTDGILLGNHYSKLIPDERKNAFTDKVIISAKRKQFILLSSYQLYNMIAYLLQNNRKELKQKIRQAIFDSKGKEFIFNPDDVNNPR